MLLSFSPNNISSSILEATLIGRKETVDQIENELIEKVIKGRTYQSLIIAPRGSGKTHITSVLYHRIKNNEKLLDKVYVAYMSEDERGIANYLDFIRHILESFVRHKEGSYRNLMSQIYEISDIPESEQENAIINLLLKFLKDRKLILLIENLNVIFNNKTGMGKIGQKKFRSFIHETNKINILSTSQSLFHYVENSDAPFYNFFNIRELDKLTFEQAYEFIKILTDLEIKNSPNSETSQKLKLEISKPTFSGKVKAIYELTGGNYRLLVIFFDFLKAEVKSDLTRIFEKAMNDLKPYYEQFLNALSPQQQKVIKYLCKEHRPKLGKDISRFCFIKSNNLSKVTSDLVQENFLEAHSVGKDSYYELKEPLMRICFEITEHKSGIVKLFVNFLSLLYSVDTIEDKALNLIKKSFSTKKTLNIASNREVLMYLQALPLDRRSKLDTILNCIDQETLFDEIKKFDKDKRINDGMTINKIIDNKDDIVHTDTNEKNFIANIRSFSFLLRDYSDNLIEQFHGFSQKNIDSIIKTLETINDLFKKKHITFTPKDAIFQNNGITYLLNNVIVSEIKNFHLDLGVFLSLIKEHELSLKVLEIGINHTSEMSRLYTSIGYNYFSLKKFNESIEASKKAVELDFGNPKCHSNLAVTLASINNYQEAIAEYEIAIKLEPTNFKYNYGLANSLSKIDRHKEARDSYLKVLKLNNSYSHIYYELAKTYIALNSNNEAIENLNKAIKLEAHQIYYFKLGKIYHNQKKYKESINNFSKAIELESNSPVPFLSRAFAFFESGNSEAAVMDIEKVIEFEPNDATYYSLLGSIHFDKEEALKALKKAIKLDSKNIRYRYELVEILFVLNKSDEVIKELNEILKLDSNNVFALSNLGHINFQSQRYDEALVFFKKASEFDPENISVINNLGLAYFGVKDYKLAEKTYSKIIVLQPDNAQAYYDLGDALSMQEKNEDAINALLMATKLDSNKSLYFFMLAVNLSIIEKYDQAHDYYKKAIKLDSRIARYYFIYGCNLSLQGKNEKALLQFKKAIKIDPKNKLYLCTLAETYSRLNNISNALRNYKKLVSLEPNNYKYHLDLASCYTNLKIFNKAINSTKKAMSLDLNNSSIHNGLGILYLKTNKITDARKEFEKGLELDNKDWHLNGSMTSAIIAEGLFDEAKLQYEIVYNLTDFEKDPFELFIFEDNLMPLFKFSDINNMSKYLIFIKNDLINKKLISKFWKALSLTIFEILINIEDYTAERIEIIRNSLVEVFEENQEVRIPLLYLDIGTRYLFNNDERALYELSKEERKVFIDFVIEKRNIFIKN